MDIRNVIEKLSKYGLKNAEYYTAVFTENDIDMEILLSLTSSEFDQLIPIIGKKVHLRNVIQTYCNQTQSPFPSYIPVNRNESATATNIDKINHEGPSRFEPKKSPSPTPSIQSSSSSSSSNQSFSQPLRRTSNDTSGWSDPMDATPLRPPLPLRSPNIQRSDDTNGKFDSRWSSAQTLKSPQPFEYPRKPAPFFPKTQDTSQSNKYQGFQRQQKISKGPTQSRIYIEPTIQQLFEARAAIQSRLQREGIEKFDNSDFELFCDEDIVPVTKFQEFGCDRTILQNITRMGYIDPTPIQQYSITCVKKRRDILASAQTGSGKTAAFLLPIISKIDDESTPDIPRSSPKALVISPTRELARQTYNECRMISHNTRIKTVCSTGGEHLYSQYKKIKENGCDILISTLGRLIHLIQSDMIDLSFLQWVAFDELDLLSLHLEDIKYICQYLPNKDQWSALGFTATIDGMDRLVEFTRLVMRSELFLNIKSSPTDIAQVFRTYLSYEEKFNMLQKDMRDMGNAQVLIICNNIEECENLNIRLLGNGHHPAVVSSNVPQTDRDISLQAFRDGKLKILIIAHLYRGLDFPNLNYVVLYNFPYTINEYIHRIGRVGRLRQKGIAISYFHEELDDKHGIKEQLYCYLKECKKPIPNWLEHEEDLITFEDSPVTAQASAPASTPTPAPNPSQSSHRNSGNIGRERQ